MARYTGPRLKKLRALNAELPGLTRKRADRRPYPPGQHGLEKARRHKETLYRKQLVEKQKLRFNYGVGEKQFRRYVVNAKKSNLAPDIALLITLERRLDNAIFRAGYAPTIPAARQLITHGHILVNGRKHDRPATLVNAGDTFALKAKAKNIGLVQASWASPSLTRPSWLVIDEAELSATVQSLPNVEEVPVIVEPSLVIEFYSKSL